MWERAEGIRSASCHLPRGRVRGRGLGRLILRRDWTRLLQRAGQPQQRDRVWTYCVRGKRNRAKADFAELTTTGKVELAGSTARGRHAGRIFVGSRASKVRTTSKLIGRGLYVRGREALALRLLRAQGPRADGGRGHPQAGIEQAPPARGGAPLAAGQGLGRQAHVRAREQGQRVHCAAAARGTQDPELNRKLALLCGLAS